MIFISDYSLRSKDILQFCYFSYREAGGLTYMWSHICAIFKKIKKIFYKKNLKKIGVQKIKNKKIFMLVYNPNQKI